MLRQAVNGLVIRRSGVRVPTPVLRTGCESSRQDASSPVFSSVEPFIFFESSDPVITLGCDRFRLNPSPELGKYSAMTLLMSCPSVPVEARGKVFGRWASGRSEGRDSAAF